MSFTAMLLGGIGSALGGAAAKSIFGDSFGDKLGGLLDSGSIRSANQGPIPPPNDRPAPSQESNPTTLRGALQLMKEQTLSGAATAGSSAIVSKLMSNMGLAEKAGANQRKALEAAFPELNPWELAGTSSAGALGSSIGSGGETATQRAEHANQQKAIDKQLENQYKIAELGSSTQLTMNAQNNYAAMAMLPYTIRESQSRTELNKSGEKVNYTKVESAPYERSLMAQQTSESAQREKLGQYGATPLGQKLATLEGMSDSDFVSGIVDMVKEYGLSQLEAFAKGGGIHMPDSQSPDPGSPAPRGAPGTKIVIPEGYGK